MQSSVIPEFLFRNFQSGAPGKENFLWEEMVLTLGRWLHPGRCSVRGGQGVPVLQLLQQEPQGVSCPSPADRFPRYQWHCWVWETPVLLPVVPVPVRDREIKLTLKLSALHNSVFIETTNLQNGLQLPKCLVLFFISSQTNKLKCQV